MTTEKVVTEKHAKYTYRVIAKHALQGVALAINSKKTWEQLSEEQQENCLYVTRLLIEGFGLIDGIKAASEGQSNETQNTQESREESREESPQEYRDEEKAAAETFAQAYQGREEETPVQITIDEKTAYPTADEEKAAAETFAQAYQGREEETPVAQITIDEKTAYPTADAETAEYFNTRAKARRERKNSTGET